jgi:O-antigen ligase
MERALAPAPSYGSDLASGHDSPGRRGFDYARTYPRGSAQARTIAAGLLLAACCGMAAGYSPLIGVGIALATVVALLMFRDLAVGLAVFTIASFGSVLSGGHVASGAKAIGFLLIVAWVATLARGPRGQALALLREQRWLVIFAVALLAWSILSAAWAASSSTALTGASRWAMDLILLPIVYTAVRRTRDVRWVMAAFLVGAILAVLYGAASGNNDDGSRLAGALGDPNETAAVMVAAAALAVALGAAERRSRRLRWASFATALAALVGLAATASRGGLIALGLTFVAAVLMAGRWRRHAAIAAGVGAVLIVGWFVLLAPASSRSHLSNLQTGRTTLWTVAGRTIEANPILGVGNDNFSVASSRYLIRPGVTTAADQIVTTPKVAHSIYLEIWADLGVVGLLLFAGLVVITLRAGVLAAARFRADGRRAEEILARGVVVAIVAMLAADIFLSDLYSKQLFLLLALAPAMSALARRQPPVQVT